MLSNLFSIGLFLNHVSRWKSATLYGVVFLMTSCAFLPGEQRVVGQIDANVLAQPVLKAPTTVTANQSFTVTITTGGNGCAKADGARVRVHNLTAEIIPYDKVLTGVPCEMGLKPLPRDIALQFASPGQATIRIMGQGPHGQVTIETQVDVQPVSR